MYLMAEAGNAQAKQEKKPGRRLALLTFVVMALLVFLLPETEAALSILFPGIQQAGNQNLKSLLSLPLTLLLPAVLIALWYLRKTGESFRDFFRLRGFSLLAALLILLIAVSLPFVINQVIKWSDSVFGKSGVMEMVAVQPDGKAGFLAQAGNFVNTLLLLALLPGICEEMVFRGAFLSLSRDSGVKALWWGVLLNALLFALFHKSLARLPYTLVLGLVLSLVVYLTGSVPAGILLHTLYNFLYVLAFALDARQYAWVAALSTLVRDTVSLPLALLGAAVVAAALYGLWKMHGNQQKRPGAAPGR